MPPTENYVSPDPQSDPAEQQAIDDDDQVIVPAPDASVFLHAPRTVPAKAAPRGQSIQFRQTVIPIVLTGGLIMIGLGLLHFVWTSDNSPLAGLPGWLVGILFVFGLILWTVAALNMLAVKQALDAKVKTTRA